MSCGQFKVSVCVGYRQYVVGVSSKALCRFGSRACRCRDSDKRSRLSRQPVARLNVIDVIILATLICTMPYPLSANRQGQSVAPSCRMRPVFLQPCVSFSGTPVWMFQSRHKLEFHNPTAPRHTRLGIIFVPSLS